MTMTCGCGAVLTGWMLARVGEIVREESICAACGRLWLAVRQAFPNESDPHMAVVTVAKR